MRCRRGMGIQEGVGAGWWGGAAGKRGEGKGKKMKPYHPRHHPNH